MKKAFSLGILYLILLSATAIFLNIITQNFVGEVVIALLLGILASNLINLPKAWNKAITFGEKVVLGWAVALMGFKLSFVAVQSLAWIVPILIVMIILSLYLGEKLAPKFGLENNTGILLGAGNAICGSSAIAAVSPVIKAKPEQTGLAISVIQILGTIGMLSFPLLASILPLDGTAWGVISGGSLQAVGQAIAGGFAISDSAGETATLIKMIRVLMLLPVVLYFSYRFRDKSVKRKIPKLPSFILVFVLFMILANIFTLPKDFLAGADMGQDFLLTFAMVAIGSKIHYKDLMVQGLKALKFGSFLFIIQLALLCLALYIKFSCFG